MDPFDAEKYQAIFQEWATDEYALRGWLAAGQVLGSRPGWHFETDLNPTAALGWCFGLAGAARLVVTVEGEGFRLYDHAADAELHLRDAGELEAWLAEHEEEHAGFTPLQGELGDFLPPANVEENETDATGD